MWYWTPKTIKCRVCASALGLWRNRGPSQLRPVSSWEWPQRQAISTAGPQIQFHSPDRQEIGNRCHKVARRRSRAPASGAETRGPGLVQPVFVGGGVRGRADEDGDALSASVPHEFGITGAVAAPPYVTGCAAGFWRPAGARQKGSWPGGLACAQGLCRQRTAVA